MSPDADLREQWRPIESAPTDDGWLLLYSREDGVRIGHRFEKWDWEAFEGGLLSPTHWMPLPDPPVPAQT